MLVGLALFFFSGPREEGTKGREHRLVVIQPTWWMPPLLRDGCSLVSAHVHRFGRTVTDHFLYRGPLTRWGAHWLRVGVWFAPALDGMGDEEQRWSHTAQCEAFLDRNLTTPYHPSQPRYPSASFTQVPSSLHMPFHSCKPLRSLSHAFSRNRMKGSHCVWRYLTTDRYFGSQAKYHQQTVPFMRAWDLSWAGLLPALLTL